MERTNIRAKTLFIFTNVNSIDFTNIQVHRRTIVRLASGKLSLEDEALISEMPKPLEVKQLPPGQLTAPKGFAKLRPDEEMSR